jgi:hypothetical protein
MTNGTTPLVVRRLDGEPVYAEPATPSSLYACLWHAWDEARDECALAYAAWREEGARDSYLVYRAAQDRADAAQDALANCYGQAADSEPIRSR